MVSISMIIVDPSNTQDLGKRVVGGKERSLDSLFDGDGDRLISVDEKGQEISGDQVLIICARNLKERGN